MGSHNISSSRTVRITTGDWPVEKLLSGCLPVSECVSDRGIIVPVMVRGTRASARLGHTSPSVSADMARDTGDTETIGVRRKKAAKEAKVNTKKEKKTVKDVEEEKKISADIQEELTQKLENLLERDRLGVGLFSQKKCLTFLVLFVISRLFGEWEKS